MVLIALAEEAGTEEEMCLSRISSEGIDSERFDISPEALGGLATTVEKQSHRLSLARHLHTRKGLRATTSANISCETGGTHSLTHGARPARVLGQLNGTNHLRRARKARRFIPAA